MSTRAGGRRSARVEYGPTAAYGPATADVPVGNGSGAVPVTLDLAGLAPSTTYHYRLVATSPVGESAAGADATFTTRRTAARRDVRRRHAAGALAAQPADGVGVTLKGTLNGPARLVATLVRAGKTAAVRA